MENTPLLVESISEGVVQLTLNRPERMNALNDALCGAFEKAISGLSAETRVVVLRGEGRGFCAGADLKERREMNETQIKAFLERMNRLFTAVEALPQVVIAALHGASLGGGLELALAADLRMASEDAFFALPEVRLGIIPGAGGSWRLPRVVGFAEAKKLILTGARIDAKEAFRIGLVHRVCADLNVETLAQAQEIAQAAPIALKTAKEILNAGFGLSREAGLYLEKAGYARTLATKDRLEGLRAFAEKRSPHYEGC